MKLLFLTIGSQRTPSTRFRVKQYFPLFDQTHFSYRHLPIPHATLKRVSLISHLHWADIIFLQKKLFSRIELTLLNCFHKPIIYDMDDVVFHEHPLYAETRQGYRTIKRNKTRFRNSLRSAATIIVGNEYLAEEIRCW